MSLTIEPARSAADLAAVRDLCWGYRDYLMQAGDGERRITETFYPEPVYAALLDRLPEEHARPGGIILLARRDDEPVGCGMSHALDPDTSEIKRVFVTETARGTGAGRALCEALIAQARADGFARIRLDTSRGFVAARRLYDRLGFHERGPYQPVPEEAAPFMCFYELAL